jgi:hypothetical protein
MKYIRDDGTMSVLLISPGQGQSAYYEESVLTRDAEKAFGGALMYFDHPTGREASERPERSVRDLMGKVVTTPAFKNGAKGPGVYAEAYVLKPHRPLVEELVAVGGFSIRVPGRKGTKVIDGKETLCATELSAGVHNSVDLVTKGARGGAAVPLAESLVAKWMQESAQPDDAEHAEAFVAWARQRETKERSDQMELQEALGRITTLEAEKGTLSDENKRLVEAVALRDGKVQIEAQIAKDGAKLPDVTKARLTEALVKAIPVKDGKLDEAGLQTMVAEAMKVEGEYVSKLVESTKPSGIRGMGGTTPADDGGKARLAEVRKSMYLKQGKTLEEADRLVAAGRE